MEMCEYKCRFCGVSIKSPRGKNVNLACFKPDEIGKCFRFIQMINSDPEIAPLILEKIWNDGFNEGKNYILTGG